MADTLDNYFTSGENRFNTLSPKGREFYDLQDPETRDAEMDKRHASMWLARRQLGDEKRYKEVYDNFETFAKHNGQEDTTPSSVYNSIAQQYANLSGKRPTKQSKAIGFIKHTADVATDTLFGQAASVFEEAGAAKEVTAAGLKKLGAEGDPTGLTSPVYSTAANIIGAPVDLLSYGLNKLGIESPEGGAFGGAESVKRGMANLGINTDSQLTEELAKDIAENTFVQVGEAIRKDKSIWGAYGAEDFERAYGVDEEFANSWIGKGAAVAGSILALAPFAGLGATGRAKNIITQLADKGLRGVATGSFIAAGWNEAVTDYEQTVLAQTGASELTPMQKAESFKVASLYAPISALLERGFGFEKVIKKYSKKQGADLTKRGIMSAVGKDTSAAGLGGGFEESSQGFVMDLLAEAYYDPERGTWTQEGAKRRGLEFILGLVGEGSMGGAFSIAGNFESRKNVQHRLLAKDGTPYGFKEMTLGLRRVRTDEELLAMGESIGMGDTILKAANGDKAAYDAYADGVMETIPDSEVLAGDMRVSDEVFFKKDGKTYVYNRQYGTQEFDAEAKSASVDALAQHTDIELAKLERDRNIAQGVPAGTYAIPYTVDLPASHGGGKVTARVDVPQQVANAGQYLVLTPQVEGMEQEEIGTFNTKTEANEAAAEWQAQQIDNMDATARQMAGQMGGAMPDMGFVYTGKAVNYNDLVRDGQMTEDEAVRQIIGSAGITSSEDEIRANLRNPERKVTYEIKGSSHLELDGTEMVDWIIQPLQGNTYDISVEERAARMALLGKDTSVLFNRMFTAVSSVSHGGSVYTVIEEGAEGFLKILSARDGVTDGSLSPAVRSMVMSWKQNFEDEVKQAKAAPEFEGYDNSDNGLIEWFSSRAIDYATGIYLNEDAEADRKLMPSGVRGFMETVRRLARMIVSKANFMNDLRRKGALPDAQEQAMRKVLGLPNEWSMQDVQSLADAGFEIFDMPQGKPMKGQTYMVAWHGTPAPKFDKFDLNYLGTGEGAQAYGWGLYFAGREDVAKWYRDQLTERSGGSVSIGGVKYFEGQNYTKTHKEMKDELGYHGYELMKIMSMRSLKLWESKDIAKSIEDMIETDMESDLYDESIAREYQELADWARANADIIEISGKPEGTMFEVVLAPSEEEYLLWDEEISQMSPLVQKAINTALDSNSYLKEFVEETALNQFNADVDELTGKDLNNILRNWAEESELNEGEMFDDPKKDVSIFLLKFGIRGNKYLDGSSRSKGEGHYNYVIFDDQDVTITKTFQITRNAEEAAFYSQLERTLSSKLQGKAASVQQVNGLLSPKHGVKPDEVKWSGIEQWLDDNADAKGKVSTADLMDYVRNAGRVKFEEVTRGGVSPIDPQAEREMREAFGGEMEPDEDGGTPYSSYVLPNGENYREVVLTMPQETPLTDAEQAERQDLIEGEQLGQLTSEQSARLGELDAKQESFTPPQPYTSSHFSDIPNYVAHMRLNERTDSEGNDGLFIEEIQSDRHQQGREKGYREEAPVPTTAKHIKGEGYAVFDQNGRRLISYGLPASTPEAEVVQRAKDKGNFPHREGIADAPFRKDWNLQMFKRALRDAVASGKSWIGWTSGETQAERYDLSSSVKSIGYTPNPDGETYKLYVNGLGNETLVDEKNASMSRIEDLVGKEIAVKIKNGEGRPNYNAPEGDKFRSLSGLDLKVGGEGMKGFYDKMLPAAVNKYVKKWGAKVEVGAVAVDRDFKQSDEDLLADLEDREASEVRDDQKTTPIHKVAITDAMRESVKQGQPTYQVVSTEEAGRLESEEHITLYRAMQKIDGKLYPPMSAVVNGKLRDPEPIGLWMRSEEDKSMLDKSGKFKLNKGNKKVVPAAYAPYFHASASPLNDQFTSAYDRPNLVTVEVRVPKSELTSGYKAEGSKKPVGETAWNTGVVSSQISKKGGDSRKVVLSRWVKNVRIVPEAEVAARIVEVLGESDVVVPVNVVTPSMRVELEKAGVRMGAPRGKFRDGAFPAGDLSLPTYQVTQTNTPEFKEWFGDSKVEYENGEPRTMAHGTYDNIGEFSYDSRGKESHFGFHFGDFNAANARLEATGDGRTNTKEYERLKARETEFYRRLRAFENELYEKKGRPTEEEMAAVRDDGIDAIMKLIKSYDYVPTQVEEAKLAKLKKDYENARVSAGFAGEGANIIPVYLSIQNPLRMVDVGDWGNVENIKESLPFDSEAESLSELMEDIQNEGYDGVVYRNAIEMLGVPEDSYIAFSPTQIKSAIGNRGTFDPTDPRITYQVADVVHYSNFPDLKVLDPAFHGSGILGAEAARKAAHPDLYVDRVYVGLEGYRKESGLLDNVYTLKVEQDLLYDVVDDQENLMPQAREQSEDADEAFTRFERMVADRGYLGIASPSQKMAAIFSKVPTDQALTKEWWEEQTGKPFEPNIIFSKKQFAKNAASEIERVRNTPFVEENGATFNADGTPYTGGGIVIGVVSQNTFIGSLTPEKQAAFAAAHATKLQHPLAKNGNYKFPESFHGSLDLSIVVPSSQQAEALEVAKYLRQESIYNMDTGKNIKTGFDGKSPREVDDAEFFELAERFSEEEKPDTSSAETESGADGGDTSTSIIAPDGTGIPIDWSAQVTVDKNAYPLIEGALYDEIMAATPTLGVIHIDRMMAGGDEEGIPLQGGMDWPAILENFAAGIGWAFNSKGMATSIINRAKANNGYLALTLMAEGNVVGNKSFAMIWLKKLNDAIADGRTTEKAALAHMNRVRVAAKKKWATELANKKRKAKAKGKTYTPDTDFPNPTKWTSVAEASEALLDLPQATRGKFYFSRQTAKNDKRGTHTKYGNLLTLTHTDALGIEPAESIVERVEEKAFKGLPMDAVVGVIYIDPNQEAAIPAAEAGVPEHLSYGMVVKGRPVGKMKNAKVLTDVYPELFAKPMLAAKKQLELGKFASHQVSIAITDEVFDKVNGGTNQVVKKEAAERESNEQREKIDAPYFDAERVAHEKALDQLEFPLEQRSFPAQFFAKYGMSMGTRLRNVNLKLFGRVREHRLGIHQRIARYQESTVAARELFKQLSRQERQVLGLHLANGTDGTAEEAQALYAKVSGLKEAIAEVRAMLDTVRHYALVNGFESNKMKNYWPRWLQDRDTFLMEEFGIEVKGKIDAAIADLNREAMKKNVAVDEEDILKVVSNVIAGTGKADSKPSNLKERGIKKLEQSWFDNYYAKPFEAVDRYINTVVEKVEKKKFFGKAAVLDETTGVRKLNLAESVAGLVGELVNSGELNVAEQEEVIAVLQAMHTKTPMHEFMQRVRSLGYISTMMKWEVAMVNFEDITSAVFTGKGLGNLRYLAGLFDTDEMSLTRDFGMDTIGVDHEDAKKSLSGFMNWGMEKSGVAFLGRGGANTQVNSGIRAYRAAAQRGKFTDTQNRRLMEFFGGDMNRVSQLKKDLAENVKTEDTVLLGWNILLDFQPMDYSEMPEGYAKGGNYRIFYMLKTFMLKRWDIFRREGIRNMRLGVAHRDKKLFLEGLRNIAWLYFLYLMGGATVDFFRDTVSGKEPTVEDALFSNMLKVAGVSRYTFYEAKRNGVPAAAFRWAMFPVPYVDYPMRDLANALGSPDSETRNMLFGRGDPDWSIGNADTWRVVPFVGSLYHWYLGGGESRQREDEAKEQRKQMRELGVKLP